MDFDTFWRMYLTNNEAAHYLNIAPSTLSIATANPQWPSTTTHIKKLRQHLTDRFTHEAVETDNPSHRRWCNEQIRYMRTLEDFDHD